MPTLLSIIFSPRRALAEIATRRSWLLSFAILAGISIIVFVWTHPFLIEATLVHLPPSATDSDKILVGQTLRSELPLRSFFLPVRLLAGWTVFAFMMYLTGKGFRPPEQLHFQKIFSLEVHAEIYLVLSRVAVLLGLIFGENDSSKMPLLVPFSAAHLIAVHDSMIFSLLNSLNFFTLLYIGALTAGISMQSGMSRTKSLVVVLLAFSLTLLFNVGMLAFLRDTLHLML